MTTVCQHSIGIKFNLINLEAPSINIAEKTFQYYQSFDNLLFLQEDVKPCLARYHPPEYKNNNIIYGHQLN